MPRGTQVINGIKYVYEYDSTWNSKKKYGTHKRKYIGKIIDDVFIPNKTYKLEEEMKEQKKRGPIAFKECKRYFYGAAYLFNAIGEITGITDDLESCFPDFYKKILSIAYFLILEPINPLSRFPKWSKIHHHPFGDNIPSQRSSDLFGQIHEKGKKQFFKLQARRRIEKEYLAYDTTSVSSYSKLLKQVKYGNNKNNEPLPQINLALLYGEESRLPVYYRKLAGNITDVMTIKRFLADVDFLNIKKVKVVMDRGFYSEANINALYKKHFKFIISAKTSLKFIKGKIDEVRDIIMTRSHYSSKYQINYYSCSIDWKYSEIKKGCSEPHISKRRMYLHIYYNAQRAVDDMLSFNKLLDMLETELLSGNPNPDHEKLYAKYYNVKKTPKRGITLSPKDEAIKQKEKNYGYFAILSNGVKDPLEALRIYRTKDLIEKAFANLKERLNMRRTSVSSDENLEGKLFVHFIALMYLSYIDKVMHDNNLYKNWTMQDLLDELDLIEGFEQPGQKFQIGEITNKQKELLHYFGVKIPS